MKKRFLSAFLACIMLLSLLPIGALAATETEISGECNASMTWKLEKTTGVLTISGTGPMPDYTYSEPAPWYKYCKLITKVVLDVPEKAPEEKSAILPAAPAEVPSESGVSSAAEILPATRDVETPPDAITSIGNYAFYECYALKEIDASKAKLSSIGTNAFCNCDALTTVLLSASTFSVGEAAFSGCASLKELNLANMTGALADQVFSGCTSLASIQLPGEMSGEVGSDCFLNCAALTKIEIPKGITGIGSNAFAGCRSLKELTLPDAVTAIGEAAFSGCAAITEIVFPAAVESIGRYAFSGTGLTKATFEGAAPAMALADARSASFPEETTLYYPYNATGWNWIQHAGYASETVYPSVEGIFKDVKDTAWYAPYVQYVYFNGLMSGMNATTFAPDDLLTRGQMAAVLWNNAEKPEPKEACVFEDVKEGTFYEKAVRWGYENKLIGGITEKNYGPLQPLTREQMCALLFRYAEFLKMDTSERGDLSSFKDAGKISNYAQDAVKWCVAVGLIHGMSPDTLAPQGTATRAQIATVLAGFDRERALQKIREAESWNDEPDPDPEVDPEPEPEPDINRNDPLYILSREIFDAVNAERKSAGLSEFTWSDKLYIAAQIRAKELAQGKEYFSHTRPNGKSYATVLTEQGITAGSRNEIIAYGYTTAAGLVKDWKVNSTTKPVLEAKIYSTVAIGAAKNSSGTYYYTMLLIG